jgi:hypothetical protein
MMRKFEAKAAFEKLFKELSTIKAMVSGMPQVQVQVSNKLLPTIVALERLGGSGTATSVSKVTGRSRPYESVCLNDLRGRGLLTKNTRGKSKIFTLKEETK